MQGVSAGKRDSSESQLPLQASKTHRFRKTRFPQCKMSFFQGVRASPAWALLMSHLVGKHTRPGMPGA